jgi:hypothetical protein
MKTLTCIAAATALMTVSAAWADTFTTSFDPRYDLDGFIFPVQATPTSRTGTLQLFDASLGTLTGARLSLFRAYQSWLTLVSTNGTDQDVTVDATTSLDLSSSLAALDPLLVDQQSDANGLLMSTDPNLHFYGGGNTNGSQPDPVELDLSSLLGALTGTGTFSITCTASASGKFTATNVRLDVMPGADCGATLTYTYTPVGNPNPGTVPEPGALSLAGLALAGAAAASRRRG